MAVLVSSVSVAAARTTTTTCTYPAQAINLSNWKLTLPVGAVGSPTEVKQPQLAAYAISPWFTVVPPCAAAQFLAPVNGVTTAGSTYPRSELREMNSDGTNASWSSTSGTHTLTILQSINRLPAVKPDVVAGQIHDSFDDVSTFRLRGTNLYITDGDLSRHKLVTSTYALGTRFEAKFVVTAGKVEAYYNGVLQTTISKSFTGAYFKAGAYTQANCATSAPCDSTNFGQVVIYSLAVTHR